jgi:hypothetical protein
MTAPVGLAQWVAAGSPLREQRVLREARFAKGSRLPEQRALQ